MDQLRPRCPPPGPGYAVLRAKSRESWRVVRNHDSPRASASHVYSWPGTGPGPSVGPMDSALARTVVQGGCGRTPPEVERACLHAPGVARGGVGVWWVAWARGIWARWSIPSPFGLRAECRVQVAHTSTLKVTFDGSGPHRPRPPPRARAPGRRRARANRKKDGHPWKSIEIHENP